MVSKGQSLAAVTDVEAQERITVGINWVDTHSGGCHGCSLYHLELPRLKKMRISENDRLSVYLPKIYNQQLKNSMLNLCNLITHIATKKFYKKLHIKIGSTIKICMQNINSFKLQ